MAEAEGATAAEVVSSSSAETASADSRWIVPEGPKPGVKYPLKVIYCEVCDGWPLEYAEHHPNYEKAKEWMEQNLTEDMKEMYLFEDAAASGGEPAVKKAQKRGGRGVIKTKKKQEIAQKICVSRAPRGKKKSVTVVTGLGTYEIDLKTASKFFASKFSCGSSVTGDDEIVIQGDVKDDLFDVIPEKWSQIDEDNIDDLGDMKR